MIYPLFIFMIILDVTWSRYNMVNKKSSQSNIIRMMGGMILWACSPNFMTMTPGQYLMFPILMMSTFWFVFDWWINLALTWSGKPRPYWYIGDNYPLDKWQRQNGGAFAWFWIKGILFIVCLVIFEVII